MQREIREIMKGNQKFGSNVARRAKPPRNVSKAKVIWTIHEERGAFVADSGTGVRVWADEVSKLQEWISA